MRFISSRLIQPAIKGKDGKYMVVVEVTDKDLNHFEDMAMCYMVNGRKPKNTLFKKEYGQQYDESHELTPEYNKFTRQLWKIFHKPWGLYDVCGCTKPGDFADLLKKYKENAAFLRFDDRYHTLDRRDLDDIKKEEAERKAKLPPEKPWVEDPVAKAEHKLLKKYVPKNVTYTMHCHDNGFMGPLDEVSFFFKGTMWTKPPVMIKRIDNDWYVVRIFYVFGHGVKLYFNLGTFEASVKSAVEVMKNAKR